VCPMKLSADLFERNEMRIDINTDPKAFAEFTKLVQRAGNPQGREDLYKWIALSKFYVTADTLFELSGGSVPTTVANGAGRTLTLGEFGLREVFRSYARQGFPDFFVDGPMHHFDGRPPSPSLKSRLADNWRAQHRLRHHDAFLEFDEAMKVPIEAFVTTARDDFSPELQVYIARKADLGTLPFFRWLDDLPGLEKLNPELAAARKAQAEHLSKTGGVL
jgi:hypothetical protein